MIAKKQIFVDRIACLSLYSCNNAAMFQAIPAFLMLLLIASCSAPSDVHETRFIMGTLVEFTIADADVTQAEKAMAAAAREMQRIEEEFTIYGDVGNRVKAFNQSEPNAVVELPGEVSAVLQTSLQIQQQSLNAFDPSLGALNLLWGFSLPDPPSSPPTAEAVAQAIPPRQCITKISQGWQRTDSRCLLDFGAIAKGFALDRGIEVLKEHGIQHAIVNAGGDLRLIGRHREKPWRIGIRHPRQKAEVVATLKLEGDVSIVTSGDYERFYMYQGRRFHHIIDPATGWPAARAQSATVIAPNAMLADAWSTALFILGAEGIRLMDQMGYATLLIDNEGKFHMNKAMREMLEKP